MRAHLLDIIANVHLSALLQPIVNLSTGTIMGYEGLIRGPSDSPLHSPLALFKVARANDLTLQIEHLCRRVVLERFAALKLAGKLFLNVSPECLLLNNVRHGETLQLISDIGIQPDRVIIELTENQPTYDYDLMREAVNHYRKMGFQIAIDDLGEGFSSLRLWSELRPDYVKIDMHFVQGINQDPVKLQFVRSIQQIAEQTGTLVIGEGIETQAELLVLRDLKIGYGQGYHLGRPMANPAVALSAEVIKALGGNGVSVYPQQVQDDKSSIYKLLRLVAPVSSGLCNNALYEIFMATPSLLIVPVVDDGRPLGLVTRLNMIDHLARPFQRELYGKKSCTVFMDPAPIIVDRGTSLQELGYNLAQADPHHLLNGFIITEHGRYLGMGTGHDLMREMTLLQINAARYANPLTQLPGNVPINEHVDRLIQGGATFWACYCDLDHFKPFNDVYGYRKGDDVIGMTAAILKNNVDPNRDFLGHIGGDDFMILFQSEDWELRCGAILTQFSQAIAAFFSPADVERGGYPSEDRQGHAMFFQLVSLSLGAVQALPGRYSSHYEIAAAAASAKTQAKKVQGNHLFLDRRSCPTPR
ncbi:GGDEF domain-containing protein [Actimicrobium antarcticum]